MDDKTADELLSLKHKKERKELQGNVKIVIH